MFNIAVVVIWVLLRRFAELFGYVCLSCRLRYLMKNKC